MNAGRSFDESVDLTKALENHYNPELAMKKLREAHKLLSSKDVPSPGYTDEELAEMGFQKGYNLTTWEEMPGAVDSNAIKKVLLQVVTGGRMGFVTGPGYSVRQEARGLRDRLKD